jgi:hypothetical protein
MSTSILRLTLTPQPPPPLEGIGDAETGLKKKFGGKDKGQKKKRYRKNERKKRSILLLTMRQSLALQSACTARTRNFFWPELDPQFWMNFL